MARIISLRRHYLDKILSEEKFYGRVLDVGGKKISKRGSFRPPLEKVDLWEYLNLDKSTKPDYHVNAEKIPVEENTFDIILMSEVLEHLEKPEIVLNELYRVLKKKGKIVLTMPFLYGIHADPFDYQRWTPTKFENVLKGLGFKEISIKPMGGFFTVIYDLFRLSLTSSSKNPNSLFKKVLFKFLMQPLARIFLKFDNIYAYKNKVITSGYYVTAFKDI